MMARTPPRPDGTDLEGLVVELVPMRRRHLRAVLRIEQQVYPRPWSLGLFLSELGLGASRAYVVARLRGSIVGYGGILLTGGDGHVTTVAVDPAWQRRTLATRILLVLAREGIARGATALTLEVRESNTAAQELYRRFGFAPAGIRRNYYVETNEDALIMWAHDVQGEEYAARLDRIEAALPGRTVVDPAVAEDRP